MPPSKSSKAKAAWDRARRYAEERGIGVKAARSILARQSEKPEARKAPPKVRKRRSAPGTKSKTPDLAAAEQQLRKKYPHIIAGTIKMHADGPHKGRRTVEIACQAKGCQNRRRIHTSDAFQTELCLDCTKLYRSQRRSKANKKGKK